ncbi:major facilitator superfamily domain-containing protein [Aspergillus ambiguus]|uniref:major facilitator superfamily domain-containing protein n=1 Tax=Aspergillus ambiguus TaxID=176160 RepID=UPI003CCD3ECB
MAQSIEALETKMTTEHNENVGQPPKEHIESDLTPAEGKKIIHKIDRRLITALGLMFAVSLMDRTNLAAANIAGMSKELELEKGFRYSITIIIFFFPHILCQWPSAVLVRKIGPRIFLPATVLTWGVVMICFGFVKTWGQLAALRALVGIFEAGLFPGTLYLLQVWYCRYDVHKRYASFYLISIVGSSLSGVLAYGFMQTGGLGGLLGWRYIFIWEGVLTCVIGIVGAFLIVDFPQKALSSWKFLMPHELDYVLKLIEDDRQDMDNDPFTWKAFLASALDLKIWGFALIFFSNTIIAYALGFFMPIILNHKMGFNVGISQVLSTPPYFFAAIYMYTQGWLADKYRIRGPFIVWNSLQGICGLCLLAWIKSAGVQYFGVFLVTAASHATLPCVMAYQANNVCGQWKRSFSSASLVIMGGTGGIVGALVFRSQDAPTYLPGIYASLACCGLSIILIGAISLHLRRMNHRATCEGAVLEGVPGFLYTL